MEWLYGDQKIINSCPRDNVLIDSIIYLSPTREQDLILDHIIPCWLIINKSN